MPDKYYLGRRPDQSGSLSRKIVIGFCLGVLLFSLIVVGFYYYNHKKLSSILPAFENALDNREYGKALSMYRDFQAEVLKMDPEKAASSSNEKQVMSSMEEIVYLRVDDIEYLIREERYIPSADDRAFLEQMGELTGARLSVWLQSLCAEFLLGTIEKPTLQYIFDQIGDYTNIMASAEPLENEINMIEIAQGDVQTAEILFANEEYIEAVEKYTAVINSYIGFVNEYASQRLQDCKNTMYDPILAECDQLVANYRYYSAEVILSDMARIFPNDQKVQTKLLNATENTALVVEYSGSINVICVKPLIADTEIAFSDNMEPSTDSLLLTANEFAAILEQLYSKNYILIDVRSMTDLTSDSLVIAETLMLPEGKKPIIVVLENLNYSAHMFGKGLCSRLVLNEQGYICGEYTNKTGQTVVKRDAEAIGILDAFVEEHPDFSFDGAKGIVSFSGYETVMGYITNQDQIEDRNAALSSVGLATINPTEADIQMNQEAVLEMMARLVETGWTLASSTYGNVNANGCDLNAITNDTNKWLEQVGILTGDVDVLVYPNGDFIKGSDPRCVVLKDNGFRIFFGVGPTAYYTYGDNYLYLDRAMLNGDTLRNKNYTRFFSVEDVYDVNRKVPLNG